MATVLAGRAASTAIAGTQSLRTSFANRIALNALVCSRQVSTEPASKSATEGSPASSAASRGPGLLRPQAPPLLDADARLKRRMIDPMDRRNGLDADPYGWAPDDRSMREAPLWMILEAEREEVRLPKPKVDTLSAEERVGAELLGPQIDSKGRAYGLGRRKTSVANVWIYPGDGLWTVNGRDIADYFPRLLHRRQAMEPFLVTSSTGAFSIKSNVHGGGPSGQAGALKLAVAKALAAYDPYLKPILKQLGHLFRDPRMVERKKPGQAGARKKFQWVKR